MGEVAVLGRTLCTKTRGRGLYQMIHSSLSASTASVFNWLIRSCLKPFSAVLPLKTRFLVQMRQDCLWLQCGWNKSSKAQNILCAQHFHQNFMRTSYSSRDVGSRVSSSFLRSIRGVCPMLFGVGEEKEDKERSIAVLWRVDHLRHQASVQHPLILVLLGGDICRDEIWLCSLEVSSGTSSLGQALEKSSA